MSFQPIELTFMSSSRKAYVSYPVINCIYWNLHLLCVLQVLSALNNTPVGQVVVGVEVLELLNPRDQNVNWTTGLIFRFNISTQPNSISDEVLWNQLISAVHSSNNTLGGTDLIVAFPQSEQAPG